MKRTLVIFAPLIAAYLAFTAWHMPLRGPLTDAEVDSFMASQAETGGAVWTDAEAFEAFLRSDDGRPFVMINLMQYRDLAEYPEGHEQAQAQSGAEAGAAYGQAVLPLLLRRGSYPMVRAERAATIINSVGDTAGAFDSLAVVRYRSRRDLIEMISSDAFLAAEVHKWASLENTLVAPAHNLPSFRIIGYTSLILLFFALGLLARRLPRRGDGPA